jgi:hypothetical protein
LELYYLGRPADAFNVMRSLGLGISNSDLSKIPIGAGSVIPSGSITTPNVLDSQIPSAQVPGASGLSYDNVYQFKYKNSSHTLTQNLYQSYYDAYAASPKSYSYAASSDPSVARNSFYGIFLNLKDGDTSIDEIVYKLKATAQAQSWSDDELVEFAMAFVQFIPYDNNKALGSITNANPYYPYETLYLNRGVCSDKSFLAILILRKLGYGAAIFDFPDFNHSAVAVSCPLEYSFASSGYCYIETTNYFPLGVVPKALTAGVATKNGDDFSDLFNAKNLGRLEIYQQTTGKIYYLISNTVSQVEEINNLDKQMKTETEAIANLKLSLETQDAEIKDMKTEMDGYFATGQISKYNSMVSGYNALVVKYNEDLSIYSDKVKTFNANVNLFNQMVQDFYQK